MKPPAESLDDGIDAGSRPAPRCQYALRGVAQEVMISDDSLDDCTYEELRPGTRC